MKKILLLFLLAITFSSCKKIIEGPEILAIGSETEDRKALCDIFNHLYPNKNYTPDMIYGYLPYGSTMRADMVDGQFRVVELNIYYTDQGISTIEHKSFPVALENLVQLKKLNIQGKINGNLPAVIGKLKRLETLSINTNMGGEIPNEIGGLTRLKSLNLSKYGGNLKDLSAQEISNMGFTSVPSSIGNLTKLTELIITGKMPALPTSAFSLTELRSLTFTSEAPMASNSIPSQIGQLIELETLSIEGNANQIVMPAETWRLPKLKKLVWSAATANGLQGIETSQLNNITIGVSENYGSVALPSSTVALEIRGKSTTIPSIPNEVSRLIVQLKSLTSLPDIPSKMYSIYIYCPDLTELPSMPEGLNTLYLKPHNIKRLEGKSLPVSLQNLTVSDYENKYDTPEPRSLEWVDAEKLEKLTELQTLSLCAKHTVDIPSRALYAMPKLNDVELHGFTGNFDFAQFFENKKKVERFTIISILPGAPSNIGGEITPETWRIFRQKGNYFTLENCRFTGTVPKDISQWFEFSGRQNQQAGYGFTIEK